MFDVSDDIAPTGRAGKSNGVIPEGRHVDNSRRRLHKGGL